MRILYFMVYYACPYGNRKPQEILNMFASYQISIDAVIMDLSPSPKQKDGILSSLKSVLLMNMMVLPSIP